MMIQSDLELTFVLCAISFMVALSALIMVPSWRARPTTLLAAVCFGMPVSFMVVLSPLPDWLAIFTCILATITGPTTILKWNGVTLTDLLQDLKRVRDSLTSKRQDTDNAGKSSPKDSDGGDAGAAS